MQNTVPDLWRGKPPNPWRVPRHSRRSINMSCDDDLEGEVRISKIYTHTHIYIYAHFIAPSEVGAGWKVLPSLYIRVASKHQSGKGSQNPKSLINIYTFLPQPSVLESAALFFLITLESRGVLVYIYAHCVLAWAWCSW